MAMCIQYGMLVRNNIHTIILYNCVHIYSFVYRYIFYVRCTKWTCGEHCTHTCIYICTYTHLYIHVLVLYTYMYICIYGYIYIHIYKYIIIIYIYVYIIETSISTCLHAGIYPCISLYVK